MQVVFDVLWFLIGVGLGIGATLLIELLTFDKFLKWIESKTNKKEKK